MEETALAFTDFASYCLTNIFVLQNDFCLFQTVNQIVFKI